MTFRTTVRDDKGQPIPGLLVTANNEITGESFSRSTDGNGYADVAMLGLSKKDDRITFSVLDPELRFKGEVRGDAMLITEADQIIEVTLAPFRKPLVSRRDWRGAFCIPAFFPDGRKLWTPAYGAYSDADRAFICGPDGLRKRHYTHVPINVAGPIYGDDFPELVDDPARFLRDLDELESAGLLPVVCPTDGRQQLPAKAFLAHAGRVRVGFPAWEMNDWLTPAEQWLLIRQCLAAAPQADWYLHMTPDHSAIDDDEPGSWRKAQQLGIVGKLHQTADFHDPERTGRQMESVALRLAGKVGAVEPLDETKRIPGIWAGLSLLTVRFEQTTTMTYHRGMTEAQQIAFDDVARTFAPTTSGFCDGGTV